MLIEYFWYVKLWGPSQRVVTLFTHKNNFYLPTILPQEVLSKAHRKVVESPRADNYVIDVHIEPHLIVPIYVMAERL